MILQATHTHLYPGHRGKVTGLAHIADIRADRDCVVDFVDGSAACARISRHQNGWLLHTDPYRTAAGTDITEKFWLIGLDEDAGQVRFRVLGKARKSL